MDTRLVLLHRWVEQTLGLNDFLLAPASADASFRRYFRLSVNGTSRIIMDAPPQQENCRPFIAVARAFRQIGLNVPEILQADLEHGFILLSDLGAVTYLSVLNNEVNTDSLYRDAIDALVVLQRDFSAPDTRLPPYDRGLLQQELELFRQWLLQTHLQLKLSAAQQHLLDDVFVLLCDEALAQPRVAVHRDYHSRNLMVTSPNPGILDFQDAVCGPVTYDLVSLLRDCYIRWPENQVNTWRDYGYKELIAAGVINAPVDQFASWFDLMGVQRHLKASGIFARLKHRDGKDGYLADVPRTLGYVVDVCTRFAELRAFGEFLQDNVLPGLHRD